MNISTELFNITAAPDMIQKADCMSWCSKLQAGVNYEFGAIFLAAYFFHLIPYQLVNIKTLEPRIKTKLIEGCKIAHSTLMFIGLIWWFLLSRGII